MPYFGYFVAATLAALLPKAAGQDTSLDDVTQAFADASIPEDLSITFTPLVLFEVTFPENTSDAITIFAGEQLPRNSTAGPPIFAINGTTPSNNTFVVAAVDPDAPTPQEPTSAQIRHFLGGNFTLDENGVLANSTPAISEFLQPTPPAGSDAHRYIFLLFNQSPEFNSQTLVAPDTPIDSFNISAFALETFLGNPIAGTFMLVAPDASA